MLLMISLLQEGRDSYEKQIKFNLKMAFVVLSRERESQIRMITIGVFNKVKVFKHCLQWFLKNLTRGTLLHLTWHKWEDLLVGVVPIIMETVEFIINLLFVELLKVLWVSIDFLPLLIKILEVFNIRLVSQLCLETDKTVTFLLEHHRIITNNNKCEQFITFISFY